MNTKLRRFEVLFPLKYNDGKEIPNNLIVEAIDEIRTRFDAARFERRQIEGHWQHQGTLYIDELACLIVDVPDTAKNHKWMKQFKARWKERLEQLELWMVSYIIDLE